MRISDWSADVCSSDHWWSKKEEPRYSSGPPRAMRRDAHRDEQNHMTTLIQTPEALAAHAARWAQCAWLTIDTEFVRVDTYYPKLCLVQKIGRASCRERVCQYVSSSVVAV